MSAGSSDRCAALTQLGQHLSEQRLQVSLRLARELGHLARLIGSRPRDLRGTASLFGSRAQLLGRCPQIFLLPSLAFLEEPLMFLALSTCFVADSVGFG